MKHRGHPRSRSRRLVRPGHWAVRARVERFVEPALLLLLRERPMHGYELIEHLPDVGGPETSVDVGNLYRVLRALEEEGIVARSTFPAVPPRVDYALTEKGLALIPIIDGMRTYGERWLGAECAATPTTGAGEAPEPVAA